MAQIENSDLIVLTRCIAISLLRFSRFAARKPAAARLQPNYHTVTACAGRNPRAAFA
jgi:hypothetical protein